MNNTREVSKPIYDLRPEDFERLVVELLRAENFRIQERVFWPRGADLIATKGEDTFIVQIKHRQALSTSEVMANFDQYIAGEDLAQNLLLVTSAKISAQQAANLKAFRPGHELSIIALQELDRLLSAHPEIAERFLGRARQRRSFQNLNLAAAALGSLASLVALIVALVGHFSNQPQPLDKRIQTVEATLISIRDLEGYLGKIKDDMVATDVAARELNKRYAEAKELEKLTDAQRQTLKQILQAEKWWRTLLNYGLGFVLGVASSLIASILYERWKQTKALRPG